MTKILEKFPRKQRAINKWETILNLEKLLQENSSKNTASFLFQKKKMFPKPHIRGHCGQTMYGYVLKLQTTLSIFSSLFFCHKTFDSPKCLSEKQTVKALIRLLLSLGLHCCLTFLSNYWCFKLSSIYWTFSTTLHAEEVFRIFLLSAFFTNFF